MPRFILRYSGATAPEEDVKIAAGSSNIKVIDQSPRMMLVEGAEQDAKQLAARMPGWTLHPEVEYKIPDARKRVVNPPE